MSAGTLDVVRTLRVSCDSLEIPVPNRLVLANVADAAPTLAAHAMPLPVDSLPTDRATQRARAGAWVDKILDDPAAWRDPEQRITMMTILAVVAAEMADLRGTVVRVHPADSDGTRLPPVDDSNARKLEVFHSNNGVDDRVMVGIEECVGKRPSYVGWGQPTFEGFADAMGVALDARAKGHSIGRTCRVTGRGKAGDFGVRLSQALRRCGEDNPDRILDLTGHATRIA
jgi:hypothetical protein